jgi:hypothetical protein
MKADRTERLIAALQRDLQPVRPFPRLRVEFVRVLGAGALLACFVVALRGPRPGAFALLDQSGPFAMLAAGLVIAVVGGVLALLASARPGRERIVWTAFFVTCATLAASAGAAMLSLLATPAATTSAPLSQDLRCTLLAILLAVPAALLLAGLAGAAAPQRPGWTGLLAALAATAVGGLIVHLTCAAPDPWHWVRSHALAPVASAILLVAPLRWLLRRRTFPRSR